jgi:hypothetical protein
MRPHAGVDYNLTLCPLQSRLQHIYHGQPYARVDLIPMPESTLYPSQGLWIWPLDILEILIVFHETFAVLFLNPDSEWRIRPDPDPNVWTTTVPTPPTLGHINKPVPA